MFVLTSLWSPPADAGRVWAVLAHPEFTWPEWWPGLTSVATGPVVGPDGLAGPGAWARLRVRSPLGYALRFRLDLVEARAPSDQDGVARLRVSGDLVGDALVTVTAAADRPGGTGGPGGPGGPATVRLVWRVSPTHAWFRSVARVAPAPLTWAHGYVMRAGERGLAARLRSPDQVGRR